MGIILLLPDRLKNYCCCNETIMVKDEIEAGLRKNGINVFMYVVVVFITLPEGCWSDSDYHNAF
jgi:hypothetical protein